MSDSSRAGGDLYDQVPYDAGSEPRTRPDRLAVISWLNGGPLPPVSDYRLLEIGCGNGANLLPMAFYHPDATFTGIDASVVHIGEARSAAEALGLRNVSFEVGDVNEIDEHLGGPFDYVLVHGLFSWVGSETRARILSLCRDQLTPEGVGYVSYNVLPGWQPHQQLRGILRRATAGIADPKSRAERAAAIATRLHELIAPDTSDPTARLLREMLGQVGRAKPFYILAEYLSEENVAFEFRDFVNLAAAHDLVHIADADYFRVTGPVEELRKAGISGVDLEQTLDLFGNRRFRASLVCRAGYPKAAKPSTTSLQEMTAGALVVPTADEPSLEDGVPERFEGMGSKRYVLSDTVSKVLIAVLAESHPRGILVRDAVLEALARLGVLTEGRPVDLSPWCGHLVALHNDGCVELRLREPVLRVEARATHPLARLEAERRPYLTTPLHTPFEIDDISRRVIDMLDGESSVQEVVDKLLGCAARGEILGELRVNEEIGLEPVLMEAVEMTLRNLGRWGLLVEE